MATVHHVADPQPEQVAATALAVDRQVEHRRLAGAMLNIVDAEGNSTVWDDAFPTDAEAYAELQRTLDEEGIDSMIGLDH